MRVRYFITSLKLEFYLLLFVVVVLIKRLNLIFFYIVLNMLLQEKNHSAAARFFSNEWSRYSDSQEVNFFLFGSSHLSTEENVELFSYAQQFIKESKRFCIFS